ncbi:hypothetical protein PR202_ga13784 [Eleusine coracana subsp. coracana]|uniref:BZIP domain-containing protein n=1 Tax=Eleusine coracana subsp. coracana TaxID=191504 RepID=A0AAV5CFX2_ELECO|nr:hypothetical protein PR202_ga13784 [Eleusine coracana subsp. coracana]
MERVFSVEEIPNPYWAPPQPQAPATGAAAGPVGGGGGTGGVAVDGAGAMNRCPSEWYFQKFLEEAVLDSPGPSTGAGRGLGGVDAVETKPPVGAPGAASSSGGGPGGVQRHAEAEAGEGPSCRRYVEVLWYSVQASGVMPPERPAASSTLPNMEASRAAPLNPIGGNGIPVQSKPVGGPTTGLGPQVVLNADVLVKQTTSSSSREQSDDDDMEGEAETTGNANPVQQRLQRRKQSNRESARRSRSRKAAHLNELEAQVAQLRVENSSLLRRLADVNQKFNDAAVDNRVLKADVETLRAKVKMAEDSVKRVTGMNALLPAVSDMSSLSMPFQGSPSDSTSDAAVPIQDDPNSYFATPSEVGANNSYMPDIASSTQEDEDFINATLAASKMGRTDSLHRVASLEHLQKRMCGGPASSGSTS